MFKKRSFQEQKTLFFTDIPQNYLHLTSGLGQTNPTSLLAVPMKVNGHVEGVIELVSFHVFEPPQIAMVEKLSESMASTIGTLKSNERTRALLAESLRHEEELRTQEEELRQNMEELSELSATQEELQRMRDEMQALHETQNNIINSIAIDFQNQFAG